MGLWWWLVEGHCEAPLHCDGVREAMSLRIAFRRGRQGEPKSPSDFSSDNVGVRRGECRDEVGRDPAKNGLFASCFDGRLWLRKVLRRAELCVLSYLELGAGVVLRTCCVSGDLGQVGVTGKSISADSWRQWMMIPVFQRQT